MALTVTTSRTSFWRNRAFEWGVLGVSTIALVGIFGHKMQVVRGQAELAAVKSTLGALRTALVIDHMHSVISPSHTSHSNSGKNPFDLLERQPANYLGTITNIIPLDAPTGSWVFDAVCRCVGYVPTNVGWIESPAGAQAMWFKVTGAQKPFLITPTERYVWQGLTID